MKNFIIIDFKIQSLCFVLLLIGFFLFSLISRDPIDLLTAFVWISLLQLTSMIIRLFFKCKKGYLFYAYLFFSIFFWIYVLYEKSGFKVSYSLQFIWILCSIYSGFIYYFFLIFYLFYSYETFRKLKT